MSESVFSRRLWLQLMPAATALVLSEGGIEAQSTSAPQRVTREMVDRALAAIGLDFTAEQRDMMLANVNRSLGSFESLRKIEVPLDTEPAFRFYPALPGQEIPAGGSRFVPSRQPHHRIARPASTEDLAFEPVTQLSALLRTHRVTSVELTRMYLDRLKRYAPKLNSVVTLTEDLAMEQAERADQEIRRGRHRGPLHGIPYGAKDLFATKGIPTTWGAEPFRNQLLDYDATVISKLEQAGAVLLAKLSMGALAQGGLWFGGMTKNPWNLDQSSSGSSAGSAASTAAGLVGFSIGTETLGSIVSPSRTCGVTGLRPTYGRVSRFGAMGLSWTMDKVGPICRSVEDCALVFNAIHGPDGKDLSVVGAPFHWHASAPVRTMKVGYVKAEFDRQEGDRKKIYDDALEVLRKAGAVLEPVDLPKMSAGPLLIILTAEAAAAFDDLTRDGGVNSLRGQAPGDWPNTFRSARLIPAVEYLRAQRARTLLMRQMDELMSKFEVIVSTTMTASLGVTNLTGHPQVVAPCGFIKGLPQALLFTGRLYEEGAPMRLAMAYEQNTLWHTMHPPVSW
jgi:Asp-tRNA(Asn)/Glu-tRNA(Gln) amidotransferase A subunit family amidase